MSVGLEPYSGVAHRRHSLVFFGFGRIQCRWTGFSLELVNMEPGVGVCGEALGKWSGALDGTLLIPYVRLQSRV
jgi:hypothetical protein